MFVIVLRGAEDRDAEVPPLGSCLLEFDPKELKIVFDASRCKTYATREAAEEERARLPIGLITEVIEAARYREEQGE